MMSDEESSKRRQRDIYIEREREKKAASKAKDRNIDIHSDMDNGQKMREYVLRSRQ